MDTDLIWALLLGSGAVAGFVTYGKYDAKQRVEAATSRAQGQLQHRRTGDYPASCSWCKNTGLARKLLVFERVQGVWRSCDLIDRLRTCSDHEVDGLASAVLTDQPHYRRFCAEKCTREFFAAEHVQIVETFVGCDYCSVRFPGALVRCPNCGAAKLAT